MTIASGRFPVLRRTRRFPSGWRRAGLLLLLVVVVLTVVYVLPERRATLSSRHFIFHFSRSLDTAAIRALADALEDSYPRVAADLATVPASVIETNVYAKRWRYGKATGHWGASGNIEGAATLHFLAQAWGEADSRKVAVHEFAHTVVLKLLLDLEPQPLDRARFDRKFARFPTWLWEATAVYEAGQYVDPRTLPYLVAGRYPRIGELNSRVAGAKSYSCGYILIRYIRARYGQEGLLRLLRNYGDLQKTFGLTDDQFCKDWYDYVRVNYLTGG